jgi:hypothetical protein
MKMNVCGVEVNGQLHAPTVLLQGLWYLLEMRQ